MSKYRRVASPQASKQQLAAALAHWFNHQAHHRGRTHGLPTGLTGEAPEIALVLYQATR